MTKKTIPFFVILKSISTFVRMTEKKITLDQIVRWTIITIITVIVLLIMDYLSTVLLPFFIAWGLAYLLYPIVRFIEQKLKIRIRAVSIILTMLAVIGIISGALWFIIPPMIEEFKKFASLAIMYLHHSTNIPSIPETISQWISENSHDIEKFLQSKDFINTIKEAAPQVFNVIGRTWHIAAGIIGSCITLLYMFFILLDYEELAGNWTKIFPQRQRTFWQDLSHDAGIALNNYVRGQGLVALTMGILFCIGFSIIGFPMAIGLGILIGILDLVPYLHTFALIPTAFLAGLKALDTGQNYWIVFGSAVIVFIVVQIIIDMIVTPKIMGKQMGLNPAILLLSLSVWGALLGFIGLIIALPLTTLIMAYWKKYVSDN